MIRMYKRDKVLVEKKSALQTVRDVDIRPNETCLAWFMPDPCAESDVASMDKHVAVILLFQRRGGVIYSWPAAVHSWINVCP